MPTFRTKKVRDTSKDITPDQLGRKYVQKNDRCLRDVPVGYTNEGKRIYAYNSYGEPICYARRSRGAAGLDPETGEHFRCQDPNTMHNGRCYRHGGKSLSGVLHPRATHLRTSEMLPTHMQGDLVRALMDPDLLSLNHEIAMIDLQVSRLKKGLGADLESPAALKMQNAITKLADSLEAGDEITEDDLHNIVDIWRKGRGEKATNRELHTCFEMRRKLSDTAHHRERDLKTMIKVDQALALIASVAAACRDAVADLFSNLEGRYYLIDRNNPLLRQANGLGETLQGSISEVVETGIDKAFKMDFLSGINTRLGSLVSVARDSVDPNYNPGEVPEHQRVPGTTGKTTGKMNRAKLLIETRGG